MNVASLELCKELYELSGWGETQNTWKRLAGLHDLKWKEWFLADYNNGKWEDLGEQSVPAYHLGYLLRKLPDDDYEIFKSSDGYLMRCVEPVGHVEADTPEDAACKLCIELFKQGVLKKEVM